MHVPSISSTTIDRGRAKFPESAFVLQLSSLFDVKISPDGRFVAVCGFTTEVFVYEVRDCVLWVCSVCSYSLDSGPLQSRERLPRCQKSLWSKGTFPLVVLNVTIAKVGLFTGSQLGHICGGLQRGCNASSHSIPRWILESVWHGHTLLSRPGSNSSQKMSDFTLLSEQLLLTDFRFHSVDPASRRDRRIRENYVVRATVPGCETISRNWLMCY